MSASRTTTQIGFGWASGPVMVAMLIGGNMAMEENNFFAALIAIGFVAVYLWLFRPVRDVLKVNRKFLMLVSVFSLLSIVLPFVVSRWNDSIEMVFILRLFNAVLTFGVGFCFWKFYTEKAVKLLGWEVSRW